ncbi:MAG: DUF4386 domain-containing protein [Gammaproteobacteria bacterium]
MTAGAHASINRTARLAGGFYLSLAPLGFFSFVYVPSVVLVRGDAAATSRNIVTSEWLFRVGTVSHLVSQIIVVFLALALYRLLKPVNKDRAVVMVVLALLLRPHIIPHGGQQPCGSAAPQPCGRRGIHHHSAPFAGDAVP